MDLIGRSENLVKGDSPVIPGPVGTRVNTRARGISRRRIDIQKAGEMDDTRRPIFNMDG